MHAMQSYLNSFSCFVENTTARVVAVCEICMSTAAITAAIKRGRGDVDVDRLRFHADMMSTAAIKTIWSLLGCYCMCSSKQCTKHMK